MQPFYSESPREQSFGDFFWPRDTTLLLVTFLTHRRPRGWHFIAFLNESKGPVFGCFVNEFFIRLESPKEGFSLSQQNWNTRRGHRLNEVEPQKSLYEFSDVNIEVFDAFVFKPSNKFSRGLGRECDMMCLSLLSLIGTSAHDNHFPQSSPLGRIALYCSSQSICPSSRAIYPSRLMATNT